MFRLNLGFDVSLLLILSASTSVTSIICLFLSSVMLLTLVPFVLIDLDIITIPIVD